MRASCPECQLQYQCVCSQIPHAPDCELHLTLLMHEKEVTRDTNTGRWLCRALPHCNAYTWQRTAIEPQLLELIQDPNTQSVVVYPAPNSMTFTELVTSTDDKRPFHFIIIDATWQEAQKIVRKSPWLKALPFVALSTQGMQSQYQLRRNQQSGHLCTLEVASVLLKEMNEPVIAKQLTAFLDEFMAVYQADKSGHALHRG
ncbi:tRNA-uridine aminocarboxypropyltransferase [Vibrio palustris]|uniref:tRNA-uridine aminocarboxypropyltransferase n=1 Tax=Vibrio palustris TaxID=1918946 RepID=A0A1R4B832_9VIBR|nr:DTW domain-containing protein [Vibrio palustris]SJL85083.1 DTW domain protein [Vibrio palustris]